MKLTPAFLASHVKDASEAKSFTLKGLKIRHIDDISYCVNMQRLDLSQNELRNPESLSGLKYCKDISWISVAHNQLTDIAYLCELAKLQGKKHVWRSSLAYVLIFLVSCFFPAVLNASYNELKDLPWDKIMNLTQLKALILNNNHLVSFPPNALLPKSLDTLVLSHNRTLDQIPASMLRKLSNLTKLSCSHTALHEISDLSECWALKEVRLASNKIFTLKGIEKKLPLTVEIIDIGHNLIRDPKDLENLLAFKKLTSLNVRGNLTDEAAEEAFIKKAIQELPNLRIFNGRNLKPSKPAKRSFTEVRVKPERANKNTKITFEE